jgi:hypothetical protein
MTQQDNVRRVLCHCVACKGKVLVPEWRTTLHLARGEWEGEDVSSNVDRPRANQEDMDLEEDVAEGDLITSMNFLTYQNTHYCIQELDAVRYWQ